jgi:hypothetical protein
MILTASLIALGTCQATFGTGALVWLPLGGLLGLVGVVMYREVVSRQTLLAEAQAPASAEPTTTLAHRIAYQPVEESLRGFLQPSQARSKAPCGTQNNDLRRDFGIASPRSRSPLSNSTACYGKTFHSLAVREPEFATLSRDFSTKRGRRVRAA